jgi:hypothetical protein
MSTLNFLKIYINGIFEKKLTQSLSKIPLNNPVCFIKANLP